MKIVALSDTHYRQWKLTIPEGDVLVHAGDATGSGSMEQCLAFIKWVSEQPHKHKVIIPGNHDWAFERSPDVLKAVCRDSGVHLLMESEVIIEGVKFWGSPATPWFNSWAFNYRRTLEEAQTFNCKFIGDIWKQMPEDAKVVITHGPPMGMLDELLRVDGTPTGILVGCQELMGRINAVKPDLHIFGHIHCGHGEKHENGTSFYNVAICDEMYMPSQPIRVIDYVP